MRAAILYLLLFLGYSFTALADIETKELKYQVDGQDFTGFLAFDNASKQHRPGVLVVHEWWGHNDYARKRAKMLAEAGYIAFALDMYGTGKLAAHPKDAKKFMQAVLGNMPQAEKRFNTAKKLLQQQEGVDSSKIAAIGYCFGGGVVLHMARSGIDLDGVVSFHGSLGTQTPAKKGQVMAQVRVFNGADDPFIPEQQIIAFKQEMDNAGVNYQFKNYPGAKHSFTNPGADSVAKKFEMPLAYNSEADKHSWQSTLKFFEEIFK